MIGIKSKVIYNLYQNGEIIPHKGDKSRRIYKDYTPRIVSENGNYRVTKMAICGCGKILVGDRLRSWRCQVCSEKNTEEYQRRYHSIKNRKYKKGVAYEYYKGEVPTVRTRKYHRAYNPDGTSFRVSKYGNPYVFTFIICSYPGCSKVTIGKNVTRKFCDKHRDLNRREREKAEASLKEKKNIGKQISKWWASYTPNKDQADRSRDNCKYRLCCLPKHIDKDVLPCKGCEIYEEAGIEGMYLP